MLRLRDLVAMFIHNCVYSELEGHNVQVSEQGTRKILYQKVSSVCWACACKLKCRCCRSLPPFRLVGSIRVKYREKVWNDLFASSVCVTPLAVSAMKKKHEKEAMCMEQEG